MALGKRAHVVLYDEEGEKVSSIDDCYRYGDTGSEVTLLMVYPNSLRTPVISAK